MNPDRILSLRTAGRDPRRTLAAPSPVLELVYACYYLTRHREGREPVAWAEALRREAPDVARAAAALADSERSRGPGRILFAMALEFGYGGDADVDRYLEDLPRLAAGLLERLEGRDAGEADEGAAWMAAWLREPPRPDWAERARVDLRALWDAIGPGWEAEGRPAAEAAAHAVAARLEEGGDVLRALPPHHFGQFETLAPTLREAHARGALRIVPLALAASGGFHLESDDDVFLGFGLQGERLHESTERRVARAAAGAKALADPTRLMLLSLIARFDDVSVTVGDLARQLGVSQPTVSGHLKLLRQAGLVTTKRRGNRTLPTADDEAIEAALAALADVLRS